MSGHDGTLVFRRVSDENFEHCARVLTPHCIEAIRGITAADVKINPEFGVKSSDFLNCIQIAAEVALAFSIERYGKPRYRIPMNRGT